MLEIPCLPLPLSLKKAHLNWVPNNAKIELIRDAASALEEVGNQVYPDACPVAYTCLCRDRIKQ